VSLDGSVITARHSRNQSYYRKVLLPSEILLGNAASGRGSEQLRQSLKAAEAR
jgi:lipid-binding SYLF domain-containing protein